MKILHSLKARICSKVIVSTVLNVSNHVALNIIPQTPTLYIVVSDIWCIVIISPFLGPHHWFGWVTIKTRITNSLRSFLVDIGMHLIITIQNSFYKSSLFYTLFNIHVFPYWKECTIWAILSNIHIKIICTKFDWNWFIVVLCSRMVTKH